MFLLKSIWYYFSIEGLQHAIDFESFSLSVTSIRSEVNFVFFKNSISRISGSAVVFEKMVYVACSWFILISSSETSDTSLTVVVISSEYGFDKVVLISLLSAVKSALVSAILWVGLFVIYWDAVMSDTVVVAVVPSWERSSKSNLFHSLSFKQSKSHFID